MFSDGGSELQVSHNVEKARPALKVLQIDFSKNPSSLSIDIGSRKCESATFTETHRRVDGFSKVWVLR